MAGRAPSDPARYPLALASGPAHAPLATQIPTETLATRLRADVIDLIRTMARANALCGAERIRGELLKLGIRVCKRTIQKCQRTARPRGDRGQTWEVFLRNHAADIWACDFLQLYDAWFRPLFAFVIIRHRTREVVHVNVTRFPTDAWVAQQLREATPYDQAHGSWSETTMGSSGATLPPPRTAPASTWSRSRPSRPT